MMDVDEERARLERVAEWYDNRQGVSAMSGRVAAAFIAQYGRGPRVLEMGTGKGVVTDILAAHFPQVEVVEGAPQNADAVEAAMGDRVTIHRCLFEEFQPEMPYNDIVMGRMLGHVHDSIATLNRAKRWLTVDGSIHIVVPNAESLHRRIGVIMGQLDAVDAQSAADVAVGQRRVYTARLLREHMNQAGLRIMWLHGTLLKPLSSAQMEEWSEDLIAAFYQVAHDLPPEWAAELYAQCKVAH